MKIKFKFNNELIGQIISLAIIFITMFNEEIKTLIFHDWKTIMFFIGCMGLVFSTLSMIMKGVCRRIIKEQFGDIVDLNKKCLEHEDYRENTLIVNTAFIKEILKTYSEEQLFEIGKNMWENQRIGINNVNKIKTFPNLSDWGFDKKVLNKITAHFYEEEKKKLTQ